MSAVPSVEQPTRRVPKVGYLGSANERAEGDPRRDAFVRGLRDLGYVPGENIIVDVRGWATEDQLTAGPGRIRTSDVIFVGPAPAARVAKLAAKDIPIVCGTCGDPVDNGLAASLARPGGPVTGLASQSAELIARGWSCSRNCSPACHASTLSSSRLTRERQRFEGARHHRSYAGFGDAASRDPRCGRIRNAFRSAASRGAGAVVLQDDPLVLSGRTQIADLALRHRLPVSSGIQELTDAGALISYGPDRADLWRRAASFVDKILKGEPGRGPGEPYAVRPDRPHLVTNGGDRSATFLVLQGIGEYDYVPLV